MSYTFDEKTATPLCVIMGRNKSDKGSSSITTSWHNYTTFYYSIFKSLRNEPLRVFELGLGTNNVSVPSNMGVDGRPGASLYGWAEFFPHAQIYGADIDRGVLFNTDRIKTYYCDQTNPTTIKAMWNEPELTKEFDIIVEDGLHEFSANVCFFENSIHKLKVGGYYIIEDLLNVELAQFKSKLNDWRTSYPNFEFTLLTIPNHNPNDNNLLVINRTA